MIELLHYIQFLFAGLFGISILLTNYYIVRLRNTGYFKNPKFHFIWNYLKIIYARQQKISDPTVLSLLVGARRVNNLFLISCLGFLLASLVSGILR